MNTNNKHAYMIMAHHKFDILKEILKDLDDERNDIFLHIDKKTLDFPQNEIKNTVKKANLILTQRQDVHWGGFSQIQCVIMLLKTAIEYGYHSYYHFMVGVEFPLKDQDYIHKFFEQNQGVEFIGFDNLDTCYYDRVRYYHIFNEYARNNNYYQKVLNKIRIICVAIQKCMNVDICKKYKILFKKGNANWSITHDLACYIVQRRKEIYRIYKHSFCGDEVFVHTLVFNSKFWDKVYDKTDEYHSSMRITTWKNPQNQYHLNDLEMLISSGRLFARKIDGDDAIELINAIKKNR